MAYLIDDDFAAAEEALQRREGEPGRAGTRSGS